MPEELQVKFTRDDILNKEFKGQVRGYSKDEVDEFLDQIMVDYELFEQKVEALEQEIKTLKNKTQRSTTTHTNQMPQTNYDVLKRLSNLEKAVFGQKRTEKVD